MTNRIVRVDPPITCCDEIWESAYLRFETSEQEIRKFMARLTKMGIIDLDRNLRVVELFCGRGNGLAALSRLGFSNLEGLDLSERLLLECTVNANLFVCDCRKLPFEDNSRDIVIVQGGLHHLPDQPNDFALTVSEVQRVLRPGGRFLVVEPWLTPFLSFVHLLCRIPPLRKLHRPLDDLSIMIEREKSTYYKWLSIPCEIDQILTNSFEPSMNYKRLGKIFFHGMKKS